MAIEGKIIDYIGNNVVNTPLIINQENDNKVEISNNIDLKIPKKIILTSAMYGSNLPTEDLVTGQLFFKIQ